MQMHLKRVVIILAAIACAITMPVFSQDENTQTATAGQMEPAPSLVTQEIVGADSRYTMGVGDVLHIEVRQQPEFSGLFVVNPEGNIQYGFAGDIQVMDLTKHQIELLIAEKIRAYVKNPDVVVMIKEYRSKVFYILGAVGRPGKYPMIGDAITLRDALISAGLPTPEAALRRTLIVTPSATKPSMVKVDIYRLLYKGELKRDIVLKAGDVVVVPTTVPSEINRALTVMLSPITRAAVVDELLDKYR